MDKTKEVLPILVSKKLVIMLCTLLILLCIILFFLIIILTADKERLESIIDLLKIFISLPVSIVLLVVLFHDEVSYFLMNLKWVKTFLGEFHADDQKTLEIVAQDKNTIEEIDKIDKDIELKTKEVEQEIKADKAKKGSIEKDSGRKAIDSLEELKEDYEVKLKNYEYRYLDRVLSLNFKKALLWISKQSQKEPLPLHKFYSSYQHFGLFGSISSQYLSGIDSGKESFGLAIEIIHALEQYGLIENNGYMITITEKGKGFLNYAF